MLSLFSAALVVLLAELVLRHLGHVSPNAAYEALVLTDLSGLALAATQHNVPCTSLFAVLAVVHGSSWWNDGGGHGHHQPPAHQPVTA
ncbi:hypothetical protein [Streptomyces sp. NPDC088925]|uniref:hypothetical protein n=1 Tax=Streptomyces sp. NPDC088925 TaxID=3365914 RepID=UPI00382DA5C7